MRVALAPPFLVLGSVVGYPRLSAVLALGAVVLHVTAAFLGYVLGISHTIGEVNVTQNGDIVVKIGTLA